MDAQSADWQLTSKMLTAVVGAFILVVGLTHIISTIQGDIAVRNKIDGSTPPTLPYSVPILGHLPEFLRNTKEFLAKATAQFGPTTPVRIHLLNRHMSILKGPENVVALFKHSRELSHVEWLVQILVNAFGVEPVDASFYLADDTGVGNQPYPDSTMSNPDHRIFHLAYASFHTGLTGARLEEIMRQLVKSLSAQITASEFPVDKWIEVPDMYELFVRKLAFKASITAFCGSHIFEVIPTLEADFWAYDSHLPTLFKEIPHWLVPGAYRSRDNIKKQLAAWHVSAGEHYDVNRAKEDERDWEEFFGARLMRTRQQYFRKMPLSKQTVAADDLGIIWAAAGNAIPAIGWMVIEIVQRPQLLQLVREQIAPHVSWDPIDSTQMVVDVPKVCAIPLLQSIYAEILRVRNGTVINRVPTISGFQIAGWSFKKDEPIIVSSYDLARDESVWNQGTAKDPHPLDNFWPERFIVDPSDPRSGPVLPPATKRQEQTDGKEPRYSMDGTAGSWIPYGGGSRMCPGRHFAKEEMIVMAAMFLTAFDIELLTKDGTFVETDMKYFMFGVMHPKGKIPARIRRRAH